MAQQPKWKRVLISGSNFEVNSLTSSADLDNYLFINAPRRLVFRSTEGAFQDTGSFINKHQQAENPILRLRSESVDVPDNPISVSVAPNPVAIPDVDPPLISFPILFKDSTFGGFEYDNFFAFQPVLQYYALQSASVQQDIQSGSDVEFTGLTAPFPKQPNGLAVTFTGTGPVTFTGSFTSQSEVTYLDGSGGNYIEWDRGLEIGQGVTASFTLPIVYTGSFSSDRYVTITLRRWLPGGYSGNIAQQEYLDQGHISAKLRDIIGSTNEQLDENPNPGATGSFTGSFEVTSLSNNPVVQGERWQLRITGDGNGTDAGMMFGYRHDKGDYDDSVGAFTFEISGSTTYGETVLTGNYSASSFIGSMDGGWSGSLIGVNLNSITNEKALFRGSGLLFRSQSGENNNPFKGLNETTMSVRLYPQNSDGVTGLTPKNRSGIEVRDVGDSYFDGTVTTGTPSPIQLAEGLPGDGLSYGTAANRESLHISVAANSGLTTSTTKLSIKNTFLGPQLTGSFGDDNSYNGSASIDVGDGLTVTEGVSVDEGKLMLSSSVAGLGLKFNQNAVNYRSVIDFDNEYAITGSGSFTLKTPSDSPIIVQQQQDGGTYQGPVTVKYSNNQFENNAKLFLQPSSGQIGLDDNFTFKDNVTVLGNLRIISSSNVTSIQSDDFQTTDAFITLNSASTFVADPFGRDVGGFIVQTASLDGNGNASGSAIYYSDGGSALPLNIKGHNFYRIGFGVTKGKIPWDAKKPFGDFESSYTVGAQTASRDFAANLSSTRLGPPPGGQSGGPDENLAGNQFYKNNQLDNLGSWFIDTASNPTGADSNVYIYGIFD